MKEHALRYVQQWGWPVFPVTPGAKTPLTAHGFHDASTDPEQIEAWWTQWPDANIGVPTGAGTKVFVVDCDIKNDKPGRESFKELHLPKTLSSRTPTGGWHAFFWHPGKEIRNRTNLRPGIDIRGDGGYVVVPPSKVFPFPPILMPAWDWMPPSTVISVPLMSMAFPQPPSMART